MNLKDFLFGSLIRTTTEASSASTTEDARLLEVPSQVITINDLLFGSRIRATTERSTTSPTEVTRLLEVFTITSVYIFVAAASFTIGFLFWGFVVLCKRRRRIHLARLR
jgi:hypothetical protein